MKQCTKCSELKPFEMFAKGKANKDGLQCQCKQCHKQHQQDKKEHYKQYMKEYLSISENKKRHYSNTKQHQSDNREKYKSVSSQWVKDNPEQHKQNVKKHHQNTTLPYHIVYLLPDHNYVGVTNNPAYRMSNHRKKEFNRNTDNWTELARFDSREDALKCEAEYHTQGYEGKKSA
jgi:predicted GIY-YIG superfamily endonuclease